jgi:hypothetical protein
MVDSLVGKCGTRILPLGADECEPTPKPSPQTACLVGTPALARASGFAGVVDLLKVAKHGPGRRVFVIDFRYEAKR